MEAIRCIVTDSIMDKRPQQQWQSLLDSANEGIWGVDADGRCTFVNRTAVRLLGYSEDELIGRDMHSLIHPRQSEGRERHCCDCPTHRVFRERRPIEQLAATLDRKSVV